MYTINSETRRSFIDVLRYRYARQLSTKLIRNKDDIMFAATNLYAYGTPFARKQLHYRPKDIPHLETILSPFVDMVWRYFNCDPNTENTQANFDLFQEKLCDTFLDIFNRDGVYVHTYGNAQKMVNMLFKYLTCFDDYEDFADLFSFCHIPIDRKVLSQFYAYNVSNVCRSGVYKEIDPATGEIVKTPWSRTDKRQYKILLDAYRSTLSAIKGGNSWLGFEYSIWSESPIPTVGTHSHRIEKFYM